MDATLRPLTTSQVLDRTFQLYRQHFLLFVGIASVGPGLSLVASLILLFSLGTPILPDPKNINPSAMLSFLVRSMIDSVVGLVVLAVGTAIATGAAIQAVSIVHLGKTTTIVQSYRNIKSSFWRILGVVVCVFFIVLLPVIGGYLAMILIGMFGGLVLGMTSLKFWGAVAGFAVGGLVFLASIVWSVYLYCRYALAVPACVIEALPVKYALRRSKFLSQGSVLRIFVIFLLMFVLSFTLTSILQVPAFFFSNPFQMRPGPVNFGYLFFVQLGQFLGRTFAGPIATIAIALVYYDERVRKEAFDLQLMMQSLPAIGTEAAASASSN